MLDKGDSPKSSSEEKVKEDLVFVLSKLLELRKNYSSEPATPPQSVPGGGYDEGTQEAKDILEKYKKSKFRVNWFSGIISYSEMLKNYSKEFSEDKEFQDLTEEVSALDKDLKELRAGENKLIPKEMVDRADSLLDKMIKKIPKLIK